MCGKDILFIMKEDRSGDAIWSGRRESFESEKKIYESRLPTFGGLDEKYDVYNCSIPFAYGGKKYIYGRVEPHDKWSSSHVYLFEETADDCYKTVDGSAPLLLEDPFIANIKGEMIFGGVRVTKMRGETVAYRTCFFRGENPLEPEYFTTGPDMMKDIRLVELPNGIGVFSRPEGYVGFTVIKDISELDDEVIKNAPIIDFISDGGYGGANQCYYLESGMIGIIGHMVYPKTNSAGQPERVYVNIAAVFDPKTKKTLMNKIIGTRRCYPESDRIRTGANGVPLDDVAFTSGIVMRKDGRADLYSGLSDSLEGRAVIDYPFGEYGKIIYGGTSF